MFLLAGHDTNMIKKILILTYIDGHQCLHMPKSQVGPLGVKDDPEVNGLMVRESWKVAHAVQLHVESRSHKGRAVGGERGGEIAGVGGADDVGAHVAQHTKPKSSR